METKTIQYIGVILIFVGLMVTFNLINLPLAQIIIDDSPPELALAEDGKPAVYPRDGETYPKVTKLIIGLKDYESGVKRVWAQIDNAIYELELYIGTIYHGVWQITMPPLKQGSYKAIFVAGNYAGLTNSWEINFQVYEGLEGKWYINNIRIATSEQTLYFTTKTLTFKFIKTVGAADPTIKCTVEYKGPEKGILTLTYQGNSTWTATKTFQPGKYTMHLKATDGISSITYTIYTAGIQQTPYELPLTLQTKIGLAILFTGIVMVAAPPLLKKK